MINRHAVRSRNRAHPKSPWHSAAGEPGAEASTEDTRNSAGDVIEPERFVDTEADELFGASTEADSPWRDNYYAHAESKRDNDRDVPDRDKTARRKHRSTGGSFNPGSPPARHGGHDWGEPAGQRDDAEPAH